MVITHKRKSQVKKLLTGSMAFALTFFFGKSERSEPLERQPQSNAQKLSESFRIPLSTSSVHATMHVSTIANLTTVLRFKANVMNTSHAQINALINKLNTEAKTARDAGDTKALLRSTKRLMLMTEVLRDRVLMTETKKK